MANARCADSGDPARRAMVVRTRPANGWDHQIPELERGNLVANFHDFSQRFVAQHEILGTRRRRAVNESANLAVGSANAHFDRPHLNFFARHDSRRFMRYFADLALARDDTNGSHFKC